MLFHRSHLIHGTVISLIVLAFIALMKLFTLQVHYLDPFSSRLQDYEVTDILFSRIMDRDRVALHDSILMVHVDEPDRADIARIIERADRHGARVIGVDILFEGRKDPVGDSLLSAALRNTDKVVLAANLMGYNAATDSIPGMVLSDTLFSNHATNAYTNFVAASNRVVRLFSPALYTEGRQYRQAFATAIVEKYDPNLTYQLRLRRTTTERINYYGDYRSFPRINAADVLEADDRDLSNFNDRIVLIGFAHSNAPDAPLEDRYFTPLNRTYTGHAMPDMYGMTIHANIVRMLLKREWIRQLPRGVVYVVAVLFTFFNVLVMQRIYHRLPDVFHGVTRLFQIAEAIVLFFIVAIFFTAFRIKLDFGLTLLAMFIAYDFVMIYENLLRKRLPYLKDLEYA